MVTYLVVVGADCYAMEYVLLVGKINHRII